MTKAEFIEQKRLSDPLWYAQHIGFNANGEQQLQEEKPIAEVVGTCANKAIDFADKYFKVGVLTCLAVMAVAIVVFTIKHK